jgi:hypothetical protein
MIGCQVSNEWKMTWKEVVLASVELLSSYLLGGIKETYEKTQSGYQASRPEFQTRASQILSKCYSFNCNTH